MPNTTLADDGAGVIWAGAMPTYEYRCGACGKNQDIVQKMSDPVLVDCPLCGAPRLERLISASAFALRGGGWYADGYGAKGTAGTTTTTDPKPAADASKPAEAAAPAAPAPTPTKSD